MRLLVLLGALAGAAIGIAVWSRHAFSRANRAWRRAAERHDGLWREPRRSWWRPVPGSLEAQIDQATVVLSIALPEDGVARTSTRAWARCAVEGAPSFEARRRLLRAGDAVTFGDARSPFVARGPSLDAIEATWTARARSLFEVIPRAHVRSDGTFVTVTIPGLVLGTAALDSMLALAAELASFGAREIARLVDLPGAVIVPRDGGSMLAIDTACGRIEVRASVAVGAPELVLILEHDRRIPGFAVAVRDGALEGVLPVGALSDEARPLVGSIEGAIAHHDGWLSVSLPLEARREMVCAAVALLVALAGGPVRTGAFR